MGTIATQIILPFLVARVGKSGGGNVRIVRRCVSWMAQLTEKFDEYVVINDLDTDVAIQCGSDQTTCVPRNQ